MKLQLKNIPIRFGLVIGVLGSLLFFLGLIFIFPIIISLIYSDGMWDAFLYSGLISTAIGGLLWWVFKPDEEVHMREAFLIVGSTWLVVSIIGALPFWIGGVLDSFADAVFESMSGFSTTGATVFGGVREDGIVNSKLVDLPKSILFWRSLTHWLGGMGIIVLTIAILPLLGIGGMQLFQAETTGPTADKLTPRVQETAKILWLVYTGLTAVLFILLWAHPSMDWFEAINHAFSTLATGGFSTHDQSIAAFNSVYIEIVLTIFMFLAGISFALHFRLFRGDFGRFFENRELRFYTYIVLISTLSISGFLYFHNDFSLFDSIRYSSFQVVSIITTTGYGSNDYELWPFFAEFIILALFFAGGCAGSTAGGIKMIRWIIMLKNNLREINVIVHPKAIMPIRVGNIVIDPAVQRSILSFFVFYILMILLGAMLLTLTGEDVVSSLTASLSCIGNIGPAFGVYGPSENYAIMNDLGKWVMVFQMMIGRLELFTILVIFSPSFWKQ